jgi:hypothetical protein
VWVSKISLAAVVPWYSGGCSALSILDAVADVVCRHDGRGGVACSRNTLNGHTLRPSLASLRRSWCSTAAFVWDGVEEGSPGVTWAKERRRSQSRDLAELLRGIWRLLGLV